MLSLVNSRKDKKQLKNGNCHLKLKIIADMVPDVQIFRFEVETLSQILRAEDADLELESGRGRVIL